MRLIANTARFISLAISCLLVTNTALADVAPPNMPPGSNPSPNAQTRVQMSAESIHITVQELTPPSYARYVDDLSYAQVSGVFTMTNRGAADETMQVRFPLADPSGMGSGFFTYPEVQNFTASVNGELKPISVISLTNPYRAKDPPVRWAAFDATFPATARGHDQRQLSHLPHRLLARSRVCLRAFHWRRLGWPHRQGRHHPAPSLHGPPLRTSSSINPRPAHTLSMAGCAGNP